MSFSEWRDVRIEDICRIRRGSSPRPIHEYISESGIPWVKISDATSSNSRYIYATKEFIKDEGKEKSRYIQKGTLILSNSATPGIPIFMGIDACVHDGWLIVDEYRGINKWFLYYTFINERERLLNLSNGSVFRNLKTDIVKNYIVQVPPLNEQKAIAKILSSLDEKIELNNQINKTLEEIAQAIFKQWFVDFEFPNEDGEPYRYSGGEMVESELGMIPKGWGVRRIGDECFCSLGGTPSRQKSDYWNGDIPWVNSGEVNNFRIYKPSEYITKLGLEKSATKLLKKKTTVLAITGATLGQVSLLEIDTCTNQSVVGISENDKVSHVYIYPYVKSVIKKIIGNQTGGAQQHINKGNVEDTKLLIPNKKVLNAYTKLVRPQYDLISSICFENELLTRLRDSLIPKLMSGEIRVSLDAEDDAS